MAWLKVYQWEGETWPQFKTIKLDRARQTAIIKKLARHFKVDAPALIQSYRHGVARGEGGGHYEPSTWHSKIAVGKITTLATICHEFAHHLSYRLHGRPKQWHGPKFKRCLKRTYTWAKRWLPIQIENQPPSVMYSNIEVAPAPDGGTVLGGKELGSGA